MPVRNPTPGRAYDVVPVFGVAAVVLAVVMVSQGVLLSPSMAHPVPPSHAARGGVERLVPAHNERSVATTPPADRLATTSALRTASSGATPAAAVCGPGLGLEHDLRLVLVAMARQRRRTMHPTAHFVRPDKQDIPASALILAKGSPAPAEPSPPAAQYPMGPAC